MIDRLGVELRADRLHVIGLRRFGTAIVSRAEVAWDPNAPDTAIAELLTLVGRARRVALAVGLPFLHVARVTLPPLGAADRRRALALDAARHFPASTHLSVSIANDVAPVDGAPEAAFAIDDEQLERWLVAFAGLGAIDVVEPAPVSLARALGASAEGRYRMPAAHGEVGLVELGGGRVDGVRRAPESELAHVGELRAFPSRGDAASDDILAFGAALGTGSSPDVQLLTRRAAQTIVARRARQVATAAIACGAAVGLALVAIAGARARLRMDLDTEIAAIAPRAAAADSVRARLIALDAASQATNHIARTRASVATALGALGERLPTDAVVQGVRWQNGEWQVDGIARSAASIVPALDADPRLRDVRTAAPSSRYVGAGATPETFSIAFHVRDTRR